ncbi:hypothetical protein F5Y16DRAFT_159795 [Xylariaceae sp. FL0255]|nr:hypothetical protein F5Y16DRAFT_159795 [Xylariaceae sp. FL0255]
MDKQLDACFNRVEKALGTLIDSIAKYNPSATQVQELGTADAALTKGLEDLQTHQSNYQRIQDLRAQTSRYDNQIKDTLRLLANTRKELVNAQATSFPEGQPRYEIRYDELLSYARRISKTTIPPVGALNAVSAALAASERDRLLLAAKSENPSASETAATTPADGTGTPTTNGMITAPGGSTAAGTPTIVNGASFESNAPTSTPTSGQPPQSTQQSQQQTQLSVATTGGSNAPTLPEPLATILNPHSAYTFVPWLSEEQVRQGAIASLAYLSEQGINAENYDPALERARREQEEEDRKAAEEAERRERDEREKRLREEQARLRAERERVRLEEERRRVSVGGPGVGGAGSAGGQQQQSSPVSGPGQKTQFQFMGDDDDDDDD